MNNIKYFILGKKSFLEKRKKYLDQFKEFSKRTLSEKIIVEALYNIEFLNSQDGRYFGSIESVLVLENFKKPGEAFSYQEKEIRIMFINFKTKETYKEHIVRLAKEFLLSIS
jgi:hypothetical protein